MVAFLPIPSKGIIETDLELFSEIVYFSFSKILREIEYLSGISNMSKVSQLKSSV